MNSGLKLASFCPRNPAPGFPWEDSMNQRSTGTHLQVINHSRARFDFQKITQFPPPYTITFIQEIIEGATNSIPDETIRTLPHLSGIFDKNLDGHFEALEDLHYFRSSLEKIEHELRSALGIILGYAAMMETGELGNTTNHQNQALKSILSSAEGLRALFEKLSTFSAIYSGNFARINIDLGELIHEIAGQYQENTQVDGIKIKTNICTEPQIVSADPVLLSAAIRYLLENAVENSPEQSIVWLICSEQSNKTQVTIIDSGNGVGIDDKDFQYRPYLSRDDSHVQARGKVGLGLWLAKTIVDIFEGRISIDSRPNLGTMVNLYFPLTHNI
jgi:K+-sensing histidine kinase KdpD